MTHQRTAIASIPLAHRDATEQRHHIYLWPAIATLLPPLSGMRILDAGCGNGLFSRKLAALGHQVTAIDISESGVAQIRASHPYIHAEVRSVYDSLEDLVPEGGFDLVFASEVIEHLYAPQEFLLNIARTLRKGGWLILSTPYHGYFKNLAISVLNGWDSHHTVQWDGGHIKFFSQHTLGELLIKLGFSGITFRNAGRVQLLGKSMVVRAHLDAQL